MVSGAPRSMLTEVDKSQIWTEQSGLGVYIGIPAEAGPLEPTYVPDMPALLNKYTVNGKITSSCDISFQVAKRLVNTSGIGVYLNRVIPDNALYGGCVVPCGTTVPARALSIGLANPQDVTFVKGSTKTAEKVSVTFKNDVNGNTGGTGFYLPGQDHVISFAIGAVQETAGYVATDDVNGSLGGRFIVLPGGAGYVWFKVKESDTDPGNATQSLAGLTGYQASFAENTNADAIALAIVNALANATGVKCTKDSENATKLYVTMNESGVTTSGSAGSSGFEYSRTKVGAAEIKALSFTDTAVHEVVIERGNTAEEIATKVYNVMKEDDSVFLSELAGTTVNFKCTETGVKLNAKVVDEAPAPVSILTTQQGSEHSGSDAVLFYFNNPSVKAQQYGIKIFNSEDFPDKAPLANTFVVEVYTKSNTRTATATVTCSRDIDAIDEYNRSIYVEDALARSTDIRAINNTDIPSTELPRSITDILWFDGGSSGSFKAGTTEKLNAYIAAAQPMIDKEEYAVSLLLPGGFYAGPYLQELDRIAQKRGEAVQISGLPTDYEESVNYMDSIEKWINEEVVLTESYSAIFSPAAKAYDSDTGRTITLPIETCIAEQIAYANENYSISQPILGFNRGTLQNITGLVRKYKFSEDGTQDGDKLYDLRINPIRQFKNRGYVIWGQKTTQRTSSARDRLNVRLMLTALKPLINDAQLGVIGELPTPVTKNDLYGQVTSIMDIGVGRFWFEDDYKVTIVDDPTLEAQHVLKIYYSIKPWNAIEYVDGYIVITNGVVSEISVN